MFLETFFYCYYHNGLHVKIILTVRFGRSIPTPLKHLITTPGDPHSITAFQPSPEPFGLGRTHHACSNVSHSFFFRSLTRSSPPQSPNTIAKLTSNGKGKILSNCNRHFLFRLLKKLSCLWQWQQQFPYLRRRRWYPCAARREHQKRRRRGRDASLAIWGTWLRWFVRIWSF